MATILLIEDDNSIQALIKETLDGGEFTVLSAYSGTEGKLLYEQNQVDLILLDLMLPGLSGEEFLDEIRQHSLVPVIVISSKSDQQSKLELLKNGADDYLIKPFDVRELLARIHIQLRHARRGPNEKQRQLTYKEVSVDLETREVKVNDQVVHLTGREYAILLLFLEHPNKVFSRANLYESVWNEPFFENTQTINMHISNLRNKLNYKQTDYIKTIWGIGFKFDE